MINEFINKEFILCDLVNRKKSVIYKEIDLDKLILGNAFNDSGIENRVDDESANKTRTDVLL